MSTTTTGTSSNTSIAQDFTAAVAEAAEVQMGAWEKADAAKAGTPAPSKPSEDKPPAVEPAQGSGASETEEATPPEGEAKSAPAPDLSWIPDNLREKFSTLDPEASEWVKGNVLRQSDYTKKTQKAAALAKEAEAVKAKADLWLALEGNPALADYAYRVLRGEAKVPGTETATAAEDDVDLTSADNATIKGYIARMVEAKAKEIADAKIQEAVVKPNRERLSIVQSLVSFADENGVDDATMDKAIAAAEAHWAGAGIKWSPENAAALVAPFVGPAKAVAPTAPSKPAAPSVAGGLAKVASPTSHPAANAPASMPKHRREKREPVTNEELVAEAAFLLREQGKDVSPQDLADLLTKQS